MLQPIHQLIVVCQSLTETEAGIQNNIIKTFGIQASDPICQKFPYFFYDTFIMSLKSATKLFSVLLASVESPGYAS